jgi:hypothetical protein
MEQLQVVGTLCLEDVVFDPFALFGASFHSFDLRMLVLESAIFKG